MPLTTSVSAASHKLPAVTDARHLPAAGPASQPPWTQAPPHLLNSANRMNISREHGVRAPLPTARGYPAGMPFNSAALNYPPRILRHPSDGVHFGQPRHVSSEQTQLMNMLRSRRPAHPGMFPPGMHRPPFSPQQQQQLYRQQMMQHQQRFHPGLFAGDPLRAAAMHQLQLLHQRADAPLQAGNSSGVRDTRTQSTASDEYAGLMTQREKDWVVKIQLLQLHTDNPYVDDYYYTCWSVKKMLKERQSREGIQSNSKDLEPTLVLPQLAKLETKTYSPTQFEGALGRLTTASIHNPRQIINVHIAPGSEADETRGVEVKRFKEFLLHIEKGYESLLSINDIEKKALAQPPENRQALYDERTQLISQLFQRLAAGHTGSDTGTETGSVENGLAQIMSVRKGLLLIIRLIPLLNQNDASTVICLLLQRFATKKEWSSEILLRVCATTEQVIQSADLHRLVQFSNTLCSNELTADKNRVNSIVSVLQNKAVQHIWAPEFSECDLDPSALNLISSSVPSTYGMSVTMCLLNQAEHIYTVESVLDLDTEHQNQWRQFVENVASAMELLGKESLSKPLGQYPLVAGHFRRILDKRSQLLVEDKLELILSSANHDSTTVT